MEKFTVDLDKVLDDFECNEDRAEEVASVSVPQRQVGLPLQCEISNAFHQPTISNTNNELGIVNTLEDTDIISRDINLIKEQQCTSTNMDTFKKSEILADNLDSINHFYTHDNSLDDKLQHKQCIGIEESESTPLTIHNDISHKLLQKCPNDNNLLMKLNSYEKKLNQPNVQPTVSNVINNFGEYIAFPNVSLVNLDKDYDSTDVDKSKQNEGVIDVTDSFITNFATTSSNSIEKCSIDDLLTAKEEDLIDNKKDHNTIPPKYQNILLPIKLEPSSSEKSNETKIDRLNQDLEFPDFIIDNNIQNFNKPEKMMKSLLDESEHVYENVYIGTDIPKTQEVFATQNKSISLEPTFEHTYENVNIAPQGVNSTNHDPNRIYECIYIGNRDNLPETNTELEIAARKMADQLNLKELENSSSTVNLSARTNPGLSTDVSAGSSTKLVFQNVQLDNSQVQVQESRPVIGFTTIDDMSEDELNKYLADLEAEDRANEIAYSFYQNIPVDNSKENLKSITLSNQQDDEDANEAPIFEAVTIGELPEVPQEDLQEKAKKFPVIDYSKGSCSGESSKEYLCTKKVPDISNITTQVKDEENKIKKSKKTHEKVRKSSDNSETMSQNSSHREEIKISKQDDTDKDKENGNYVSTGDTDNNQIKVSSENLETEQNRNLNSTNTASQIENVDNKNLDNNEQSATHSLDENKLVNTRTPIRNTETISRFSVTRNVDVNDKLGVRSKPSQSHSRVKSKENCSEHNESSDDDPNRPSRPQTLDVISTVNMSDACNAGISFNQETSDAEGDKDSGRAPSPDISENSSMESGTVLGKQPPFWVPDSDAPNCMLCDIKFTVMKRRHHCRACGKVLCNKCCNMKYRLEYQNNVYSRVCFPCLQLLTKAESDTGSGDYPGFSNINNAGINSPQLAGGLPPPPTVMVPVGVLKREGSTKQRSEGPKSVMFSDGIRPGCDLTELDTTWDWKPPALRKTGSRRVVGSGYMVSSSSKKQNCPPVDPATNSYIPQDPPTLPPTVTIHKGQVTYHDITDTTTLYASLKNECEPPVMFAINRNLYALVKIIDLSCCANKICWNITSKGLACVGQDELVFLIEVLPDETEVPRDLLLHINQIYHDAIKGNTISEYGMSIHQNGHLLGSREHAGFLFIRQTLQCLQKVITPPAPFLVGLLVHRWETPWAKVFPLRLVLRLGAEYRYYPCPLVSVRFRNAVYFEIGHTIMKVLADFRNFAYTLPKVQGLTIHVQDKTTYVRFPKNRYDQVIKGLNNSNDHVLAFASNFSIQADSHYVCMQTNSEDESTYQTQAINIQNKPRKVTGASFIVINGALKSSMGLSANSSILEDGLMVQIMPEKMEALKAALKNMLDFTIGCGRQGAPEPDEIVYIKWVENDTQFNLGVKSPIDGKRMNGIPSIRVHNGINFVGTSRFIRWTEVFILKSDDDQPFGMHYPVDINKLSENIARATCAALVKLLDLLANAGLTKIAVRTTIHPDNVGYEAGSEGNRLPPIYMNSLDNELIQVLQKAVQGCEDSQIVLELVFYILETEI